MDLCACICAQIQQHLQTVQQILNGLSNGPPVITQSGDVLPDFSVPESSSMDATHVMGALFLILFTTALFVMGRQRAPEREREREQQITSPNKPTGPPHGHGRGPPGPPGPAVD